MANEAYWPFPTLSPDEQTEHHREAIQFLERAFSEGFRPYRFDRSNFGASTASGRLGELIHRGRDRWWEVLLHQKETSTSSFFVDGFTPAAEALLRWLRGEPLPAIVVLLQGAIVSAPGIQARDGAVSGLGLEVPHLARPG